MASYKIEWNDGNKPRVNYKDCDDDMELRDWLQNQEIIPLQLISYITQERNVILYIDKYKFQIGK